MCIRDRIEIDTVPYTTIVGQRSGAADFFSVTVGAGQRLSADIDFADGDLGGPSFDSMLALFDGSMNELASNDDGDISQGRWGSSSGLDSFLTWTNLSNTAVTVFVQVDRFGGNNFFAEETYLLGISVTGHANTNIAEQGADSILSLIHI